MKIAILGRSDTLWEVCRILAESDHEIVGIVSGKEAPEYTRTVDDFRRLAFEYDVPFCGEINVRKMEEMLRQVNADIGVSVNFPSIIPQPIIDLCPLGILNAHGGDLPRYRGNACQAWALINGEPRIGLCIHKMIGGELDSGDIIEREFLATNIDTKISDVLQWMALRTPHLFLSAIAKLLVDPDYVLERQSGLRCDVLRCYPRRPEDGRINWSNSAESIVRLINASGPPYPGAFSTLDGEVVNFWEASLVDDRERFLAVPGQVIEINKILGYFTVATGAGKIDISHSSVQFAQTSASAPASVTLNSLRQRFV